MREPGARLVSEDKVLSRNPFTEGIAAGGARERLCVRPTVNTGQE